MAGRGPQSFKKRQKEQARKEKQQEKAAKRVQRKVDKDNPLAVEEIDDNIESDVDELSVDEVVARLVGGPIDR
ncbi:MAG TPA: hypothetical protein VEX68_04640 [Bryobacteraceae bacterium]|nr:hypothetical protein [Bryobacteraceae bacterium]